MSFNKRLTGKQLLAFFGFLFLSFFWLWLLKDTEACYFIYAVIAIVFCAFAYGSAGENVAVSINIREKIILAVLCAVYGLCVTAANFNCFDALPYSAIKAIRLLYCALLMLCTSLIMMKTSSVAYACFGKCLSLSRMQNDRHARYVFAMSFALIVLVNLFVLFTTQYPGIVSRDSSAAVAALSVIQILMMAAIFAFSIMTLYEASVSRKVRMAGLLFTALVPYNVLYSFTIWNPVSGRIWRSLA